MKRIATLLGDTVIEWFEHDALTMAAALSFYTILSMAPFLILIVGLAAFLLDQEQAKQQILAQVAFLIGRAGADFFKALLENPSRNSGGIAPVIGIITLLFGASSIFVELNSALNKLWHFTPPATPDTSRLVQVWSLLRFRFFAVGLVWATGFLVQLSLVMSAVLAYVSQIYESWMPKAFLMVVDQIVSLFAFTIIFAFIYRYVPSHLMPWRLVWQGAAATSLMFILGKWLIGIYLGRVSVGSSYGAAGSIVVFMVWIYYSTAIFLLGAAFTRVLWVRMTQKPALAGQSGRLPLASSAAHP